MQIPKRSNNEVLLFNKMYIKMKQTFFYLAVQIEFTIDVF